LTLALTGCKRAQKAERAASGKESTLPDVVIRALHSVIVWGVQGLLRWVEVFHESGARGCNRCGPKERRFRGPPECREAVGCRRHRLPERPPRRKHLLPNTTHARSKAMAPQSAHVHSCHFADTRASGRPPPSPLTRPHPNAQLTARRGVWVLSCSGKGLVLL